jgi:hypothetical protein
MADVGQLANRLTIKQGAWLAGVLLVVMLIAWALYLLSAGLPVTRTAEARPGEPPPPAQVLYLPYEPARLSLVLLAAVLIGLLGDRWLPLAWIGIALHLAYGVLLIFSLGALYIVAAAALAVPAGILQAHLDPPAPGMPAAWGGAAIVLAAGILFSGDEIGYYILLAGILLALAVAGVQWRRWRRPAGAERP